MSTKLIILLVAALVVTVTDARGGHGGGGHGHGGGGGGHGHGDGEGDGSGHAEGGHAEEANSGYDEEIDGVWYHVDENGNKTKITNNIMG